MTTMLTSLDIERIEECHPEIQKLFYKAAKDPKCPPFIVIDGGRTLAEQKKNVKNGASKTMRSRHLIADNGWSHAIDIAPRIKGKLSWKSEHYKPLVNEIFDIADDLKVPIEWGGHWKSFKDYPHFQLPWKTFPGTKKSVDVFSYKDELLYHHEPLKPKDAFNRYINEVLESEGGFTDDPNDAGGPTNKGITIEVFKKYIKPDGTVHDLKIMTRSQAEDVFRQQYWNACRCDELPEGVNYTVFDFAVNSGNHRAKTYLQNIVGTEVDGRMGPDTMAAVRSMEPVAIITRLNAARKRYIIDRVKSGRLHKSFERGILSRVDRVLETSLRTAKEKRIENTSRSIVGDIFDSLFLLIRWALGGK